MKGFRCWQVLLGSCVAVSVSAAPLGCDGESQTRLRLEADAGVSKAQYEWGRQLLAGRCGASEPQAGFDQVARAASGNYPPAMHLMGEILRQEGKVEEAASFFFGAAQRGFRLAEVELGFLHSEEDSPVRNDPMAFAWFSLAIGHERQAESKRALQMSLAKLAARMSEAERAEGRRLKKRLVENLGAVPVFGEQP